VLNAELSATLCAVSGVRHVGEMRAGLLDQPGTGREMGDIIWQAYHVQDARWRDIQDGTLFVQWEE
jgi:hypothetical protein